MAATERNTGILQCKENVKHYGTHTQITPLPRVYVGRKWHPIHQVTTQDQKNCIKNR